MRAFGPALVVAAVVLAVVPTIRATPCASPLDPCLVLEVPTPADVYYLDHRGVALGYGTWIYEESNGVFVGGDPARDLQRGAGCSPYVPDDCDGLYPWIDDGVAAGLYPPDTLIY
jgi:hypothetical protein